MRFFSFQLCFYILLITVLLISDTQKAYGKAYGRVIRGIPTGPKNMCHLFLRIDFCKNLSNIYSYGWCDGGWIHHCCFMESAPLEGQSMCVQSGTCEYTCFW